MSFWTELNGDEKERIEPYLKNTTFKEGGCIFRENDSAGGCYILLEGVVRLEIQHSETESDNVLGHLDAGQLLGEFSLTESSRRSASAYAETKVEAKWLSTDAYHQLCKDLPDIGFKIANALVKELSDKIRKQNMVLAGYLSLDEVDSSTDIMVQRAKTAQFEFEHLTEEKVDRVLKDIANAIWEESESLALETVEVTNIGKSHDKVQKIYFATKEVMKWLVGQSARGPLRKEKRSSFPYIEELGDPAGVVFGLIPITNPVPTIVYKTLISLKSRNALVVSPHRAALPIANATVDLIRDVLINHGLPVDLIQNIRKRTSRRKTMMFMKHPDVSLILATGGPNMVNAAYSSGTPAIGVGSGNAPVWIADDANIEEAADNVVKSKSFDNGIICGSENNLLVDSSIRKELIKQLELKGAYVLNQQEKRKALDILFDSKTHHVKKDFVGQPAEYLMKLLGLKTEDNHQVKLLIMPANINELNGPLGNEKLAPMLSLFEIGSIEEAIKTAKKVLEKEGQGHTAVVHTDDEAKARKYGDAMPTGRILVNAPSSHGCIGVGTGLFPAFTLGCGTYGGNSTTDNVNYAHLMNVKRLAFAG